MRPRQASFVAPRSLSWLVAALLWLLTSGSVHAQPTVIDLEGFQAGHVLTDADLPAGVTLTVTNSDPAHPQKAIIFESNCPTGCSGGDFDLRTPGSGIGNDTSQGKVLIIAENDIDANADGLVDDPDDEEAGGSIRLDFSRPLKILSVRVIDIEEMDEFPSGLLQELIGGGTVFLAYAELGNNSAQTLVNPNAMSVSAVEFVFESTGAIDDIVVQLACGDGILDPGEECDPPDGVTCDDDCQLIDIVTTTVPATTTTLPATTTTLPATTTTVPATTTTLPATTTTLSVTTTTLSVTTTTMSVTTTTLPLCGNGVIDPGEECDPPDGPEICDNGVDDTGNGLVDCDDPSCQAFSDANPFCGENCTEGVCTPILEDPAIIKLPRDDEPGYFRLHGRVKLGGRVVDPVGRGFGISISNSHGEIWSAALEPGDMVPQGVRQKRFRYKDKAARRVGGGVRSGLYKVTTRLRRVNRADAYIFTIQAYSDDFARATEARMTTQVYGVGGVGILTADWRPTRRGWKLRNVDLR